MKRKLEKLDSIVKRILILVISTLVILSIVNVLSLIFEMRPNVVMIYFMFGAIISYVALTYYDKFIQRKEDPLPDYILKEVQVIKNEVDVLQEMLSEEQGTTKEEVKVRAKARRKVNHEKARSKR
ncbi:putative membrane protein [Staphylococcus phage Twort]|uniref:Membrane protein n=2 Tax=Staphylococcus phage Twort (strain DSM 17442 / HER 48) TaxID=2908167 RepID=A0A6H0X5F6_BPTWO|nr:putative membrane protein [Staphylococcus phage Twort]